MFGFVANTRTLPSDRTSVEKNGTGDKVNACYGGHSMQVEVKDLNVPPALLIGTPGRIADYIRRETFKLDGIKILALDEFDKSLELAFRMRWIYY